MFIECFIMDFLFLWESDFDFFYYIKIYGVFIGREWLIEDFSYYLLYIEYRGILIVVEMGFGKLVIVLNIICDSDKFFFGYFIYLKFMLVYFCCFDLYIILNFGIFVRNMVGGIVGKFLEFGNIIYLDKMVYEYFFINYCLEDL